MASAAAVSVEAEWAEAAGEDDDFQELHEAIASGKAQRFGGCGGGPDREGETAKFTGKNLPSGINCIGNSAIRISGVCDLQSNVFICTVY